MTQDNLHQNLSPWNKNKIQGQTGSQVELSKEQWIKHCELINIGSAMAKYLKGLSTTSSFSFPTRFKLHSSAILTLLGKDAEKNYIQCLSQHWFELMDALGFIYLKPLKKTNAKIK